MGNTWSPLWVDLDTRYWLKEEKMLSFEIDSDLRYRFEMSMKALTTQFHMHCRASVEKYSFC